jgi:glycosylphosphatidylinositol transamidase (GPIT) subunit GPI8
MQPRLLILLGLLLLLLQAPPVNAKAGGSNHTSNWAVLVATSKVGGLKLKRHLVLHPFKQSAEVAAAISNSR